MTSAKSESSLRTPPASAHRAVLKVGDGRGFVIAAEHGQFGEQRYVVTAAHCLPFQPPPHPAMYLNEKTYEKLLGPLGSEPTIWAECLFVDPIADIALLGAPDDQALPAEGEAYEQLVHGPALKVGVLPPRVTVDGWVLSLKGQWVPCKVEHGGGI